VEAFEDLYAQVLPAAAIVLCLGTLVVQGRTSQGIRPGVVGDFHDSLLQYLSILLVR
jgi:hypothetical protein